MLMQEAKRTGAEKKGNCIKITQIPLCKPSASAKRTNQIKKCRKICKCLRSIFAGWFYADCHSNSILNTSFNVFIDFIVFVKPQLLLGADIFSGVTFFHLIEGKKKLLSLAFAIIQFPLVAHIKYNQVIVGRGSIVRFHCHFHNSIERNDFDVRKCFRWNIRKLLLSCLIIWTTKRCWEIMIIEYIFQCKCCWSFSNQQNNWQTKYLQLHFGKSVILQPPVDVYPQFVSYNKHEHLRDDVSVSGTKCLWLYSAMKYGQSNNNSIWKCT